MKVEVQYLNDVNGDVQAVQLPFLTWKKLINKLNKYEQALKLKSDLQEALAQVNDLKKSKGQKQTLNDFLNEV